MNHDDIAFSVWMKTYSVIAGRRVAEGIDHTLTKDEARRYMKDHPDTEKTESQLVMDAKPDVDIEDNSPEAEHRFITTMDLLDAGYRDQMKKGDVDSAQRTLDRAAIENGYYILYRGHSSSNDAYDSRLGTPTFTDSQAVANVYANKNDDGTLTRSYIKFKKPFIFAEETGAITKNELMEALGPEAAEKVGSNVQWTSDGEPADYEDIPDDGYTEMYYLANSKSFADELRQKGYDGIIFYGLAGMPSGIEIDTSMDIGSYNDDITREFRPLYPETVKSSDLEVRDDNGNILMPSQRFA